MNTFLDLAKDISLGIVSICGLLLTVLLGLVLLSKPEINPQNILVSSVCFILSPLLGVMSLYLILISAEKTAANQSPVGQVNWRWAIARVVEGEILFFIIGLGGLFSSLLHAMHLW